MKRSLVIPEEAKPSVAQKLRPRVSALAVPPTIHKFERISLVHEQGAKKGSPSKSGGAKMGSPKAKGSIGPMGTTGPKPSRSSSAHGGQSRARGTRDYSKEGVRESFREYSGEYASDSSGVKKSGGIRTSSLAQKGGVREGCGVDISGGADWGYIAESVGKGFDLLRAILESLKGKSDPYKTLVDYVDYMQDVRMDPAVGVFVSPEVRSLFRQAFVLERAAVLGVFYFTLEESLEGQGDSCVRAVDFALKNLLIFAKVLADEAAAAAAAAPLARLVAARLAPRNAEFFRRKLGLSSYTAAARLYAEKLAAFLAPLASCGFAGIVEALKKVGEARLDVEEAVEVLTVGFAPFFASKNVVAQVPDGLGSCGALESAQTSGTSCLLPPTSRLYTLVVDLDETLVHFDPRTHQVFVRPHCREFLEGVSRFFEVVVYTAATQEYADWILDRLDLRRCVAHRLYRHHLAPTNSTSVKDLSRLGRDLASTLIVDDLKENFARQRENGIHVVPWLGDDSDTALQILEQALVGIAKLIPSDLRPPLAQLRESGGLHGVER